MKCYHARRPDGRPMIELTDVRRMTGDQFKVWFVLHQLVGDDGAARLSLRGLAYHAGMTVDATAAALDGLAAVQINGAAVLTWQRLPGQPRRTRSALVLVRLWPAPARG
jgi:hypothetical protein